MIIILYFSVNMQTSDHVTVKDFELLKVLGTGGKFVCFVASFTSQVNSYGHGGMVSSPNHTFSWASLSKGLTRTSCTYFRL